MELKERTYFVVLRLYWAKGNGFGSQFRIGQMRALHGGPVYDAVRQWQEIIKKEEPGFGICRLESISPARPLHAKESEIIDIRLVIGEQVAHEIDMHYRALAQDHQQPQAGICL